MYRDEAADPPALVCQVGSTRLRYHLRAIEDLHARLKSKDDWMPLGGADEQKPAAEGTVEAWGGPRTTPWAAGTASGRAYMEDSVYLPPLLEALGARRVDARRPQQPDARAPSPETGRGY